MARSKAHLFDNDEQLGSQLSMALAHPARFRMMQRLILGDSISYLELIGGIPLAESTVNNHLDIIKRLNFTLPADLADGTTGYRLNTELYQDCILATRRLLRRDSRVVRLAQEGDVSAV